MKLDAFPKDFSHLHHAYFLSNVSEGEVWQNIEEKLSFKKAGNLDALSLDFENFGIDDARELFNWAIKKPFGQNKIAVVSLSSFTVEAQNALLKLFEEPPQNTYFFVIMEDIGASLPTLLSRVHILSGVEEGKKSGKALDFIKSSVPDRLKMISKIIKDKDRGEARNFIVDLLKESRDKKINSNLEPLMKAERYITSRSSSVKMILEHLSVTLRV